MWSSSAPGARSTGVEPDEASRVGLDRDEVGDELVHREAGPGRHGPVGVAEAVEHVAEVVDLTGDGLDRDRECPRSTTARCGRSEMPAISASRSSPGAGRGGDRAEPRRRVAERRQLVDQLGMAGELVEEGDLVGDVEGVEGERREEIEVDGIGWARSCADPFRLEDLGQSSERDSQPGLRRALRDVEGRGDAPVGHPAEVRQLDRLSLLGRKLGDGAPDALGDEHAVAASATSGTAGTATDAFRSSRRRAATSLLSQSTARRWVITPRYARSVPRSGSNRFGCSQSAVNTAWVTSWAADGSPATRRASP